MRRCSGPLGAEKTEDGLLVATPCSLLTVNWAEPEDLEGYRYCHWYMEQLSDLPAEEKRARYTPPEGETGWLIPAEELEQAAGERFGVSAEHLRADTDCYREDLGGYQTGGVGIGDRPVLTVTAVRADGDREILTVQEEWTVEQRSGAIELTIRRNGEDWQAVSCMPGAPGRSCPDCPGPAGPAGLWRPGGGRRPALLWDQPVLSRWLGQFQRAHRRGRLGLVLRLCPEYRPGRGTPDPLRLPQRQRPDGSSPRRRWNPPSCGTLRSSRAIRWNCCARIPGIMTRNTRATSSPAVMGAAAPSRRYASAQSPRRGIRW